MVGYQLTLRPEEFRVSDPITGLEQLEALARAFPDGQRPLAEAYPHVARMAALSLKVLASLGDPDEVDGLTGFEGFGFWRESR